MKSWAIVEVVILPILKPNFFHKALGCTGAEVYEIGVGCIASCPATHYYTEQRSYGTICEKCFVNCAKCTGPQYSDCLGCDKDYYLTGNVC
jgi:hypothetical protein